MGVANRPLERFVVGFVWLFGILLALAAVLAGGCAIWTHVWSERVRDRDHPHFAATDFADRVSFTAVRATRAWHPRDARPQDCTFAIVDLDLPGPDPAADDTAWQTRWPGGSHRTPADHPGHTNRDALLGCAKAFDEETNRKLRAAVTEPGSSYAGDSVGEDVYVHSAPRGMAADIRHGD